MTRMIGPLALAAVLALAACSRSEEAKPPAAAPAAPAAPAVPAAPAAPAALPVSSAPDPRAGEPLYATYCASCHGARGAGDGPAAAALDPKPAHHDDGAYMNALSNEHLFKVIQQGGPAVGKSALMAPWGGTLNEKQIWDVVAFVRSLANPPYAGSVP